MSTHNLARHLGSLAAICLALCILLLPATSRADATTTPTLPLQDRLQASVTAASDLDPTASEQMQANLRVCLQAGLDPAQLVGLFPLDDRPHLGGPEALRAQATVISALSAELPVNLILAKIQEGCRKGVDGARIVAAAARMQECLTVAHRVLATATTDGLALAAATTDHATDNLAMHVWSGLTADDLGALTSSATQRKSGQACTVDDLLAASGCAVSLVGAGADHANAVALAGEVLGHGLSAQEIREVAALVTAAQQRSPGFEDILSTVRADLDRGLGAKDMAQQMLRAGWLGPAEVPGAGGRGMGPAAGPGSPGYPGGAGNDPSLGTGNTNEGGGGGNSSGGGRKSGR